VSRQLHALTASLQGKEPQYALDRRLCGPQNRSGRRRKEKTLASTGLELQPLGRPASLYTDCINLAPATEVNRKECWSGRPIVTECRRMLTHDLLPVRFTQDWLKLIQKNALYTHKLTTIVTHNNIKILQLHA
jgi:hypothetical protein